MITIDNQHVKFCAQKGNTVSGWWFQPPWKILVSWDAYSQYIYIYGKIKNVPNHQPGLIMESRFISPVLAIIFLETRRFSKVQPFLRDSEPCHRAYIVQGSSHLVSGYWVFKHPLTQLETEKQWKTMVKPWKTMAWKNPWKNMKNHAKPMKTLRIWFRNQDQSIWPPKRSTCTTCCSSRWVPQRFFVSLLPDASHDWGILMGSMAHHI